MSVSEQKTDAPETVEKSKEVIPVSSYKKQSGLKVQQHERSLPKKRERSDDEQHQQEEEQEQPKEAAPLSEPKTRRSLTVQEYLAMDYTEQQKILVLEKMKKDPSLKDDVERDLMHNAIVEKDIALQKAASIAGQSISKNQEQQEPSFDSNPLGYEDMLLHLDELYDQDPGNDTLLSIIKHHVANKYNEGGEFGLKCLVPHLRAAGQHQLARDVMANKYAF